MVAVFNDDIGYISFLKYGLGIFLQFAAVVGEHAELTQNPQVFCKQAAAIFKGMPCISQVGYCYVVPEEQHGHQQWRGKYK